MSAPELLREVDLVVVHHSASPRAHTRLEHIRAWHVARGFRDVGYHYVIEGDGMVRVGRPLPQMGAHCLGANRHSVGVCVVGDNRYPAEQWTPAQIAALEELVHALRTVWPEARLCGHAEAGETPTLCPVVDVPALLARARPPHRTPPAWQCPDVSEPPPPQLDP